MMRCEAEIEGHRYREGLCGDACTRIGCRRTSTARVEERRCLDPMVACTHTRGLIRCSHSFLYTPRVCDQENRAGTSDSCVYKWRVCVQPIRMCERDSCVRKRFV